MSSVPSKNPSDPATPRAARRDGGRARRPAAARGARAAEAAGDGCGYGPISAHDAAAGLLALSAGGESALVPSSPVPSRRRAHPAVVRSPWLALG